MLESLSNKVQECYRQAEDCARQAETQSDPVLKQAFLDNERRWLRLAASYEFAERLQRFTSKPKE